MRIFRLSCSYGNRLGATVSKGSRDKDRSEAADAIDERCVAHIPVFRPDVLVISVTSTVNGYAQDDEDDYGDDLEKRQPVFHLTVRTYGDDVEADQYEEEDQT